MNSFLQLPAVRRRLAFQQVDAEKGLQALSVEKDFWVCWILRQLFTLPGIGEHLTFKGGTSLSKAWQLIERFSEDIDLVVDKEVLGFGGSAAPDKASSSNQRKKRLEDLMAASANWVGGTLQSALGYGTNWGPRVGHWKSIPTSRMDSASCSSIHPSSQPPPLVIFPRG